MQIGISSNNFSHKNLLDRLTAVGAMAGFPSL